MTEIRVTLTQDDIDEVRENGYCIRKGIAFCDRMEVLEEVDEHGIVDGTVLLAAETLYRNGEAYWKTAVEGATIVAEYERPSLERLVESEMAYYEDSGTVWSDGVLYAMENVKHWTEG